MSEITFEDVMIYLIASYPGQELTDANIDAYQETLADIPPATLKAAAVKHVQESQWFPRPAELYRAARMFDDGRGVQAPPVVENDYWSAMSIIKGGLTGVIPAEAAHTDKRVAGVLKMTRREWTSEQG